MAIGTAVRDGVGNAGGVAWPLFGIVSAISFMSPGALYILSLCSCGIFIFFTLPLIAVFASKSINENQQLNDSLHKARDELKGRLRSLLACLKEIDEIGNEEQANLLRQKLFLSDDPLMQEVLAKLQRVLNKKNKNDLTEKELMIFINRLLLTTLPRNHNPVPIIQLIIPFLTTFPGVFGTIMGGAAGIMGVFAGVGLIAGFSAVPVLGWFLLGGAITAGLTLGIRASYQAYKVHHQKQNINLLTDLSEKCRQQKKMNKRNCAMSSLHSNATDSPVLSAGNVRTADLEQGVSSNGRQNVKPSSEVFSLHEEPVNGLSSSF